VAVAQEAEGGGAGDGRGGGGVLVVDLSWVGWCLSDGRWAVALPSLERTGIRTHKSPASSASSAKATLCWSAQDGWNSLSQPVSEG